MRSRALYLMSIFLLFTLVACSKKPADTASNSASQDTAAPSNAAGGNAMNSPTAPAAPAPPEPQPLVVPAGTTLTVRLGESVGSKISSPGQSFSATLASPVAVDGNTVIPAGASARGTVVDALKGKGKRTAVMAGGGTALGAIIGGLAGGGKGAAIGAAAGAGAGTGGAAFTGNKEIVLPAESALSFRLTSPLEVNAGR